jgi:hypothetical protein
VLDWEFALAGSPLFDTGNMLRFDHVLPTNSSSEFIRGYQEHGGQLPAQVSQFVQRHQMRRISEKDAAA